MPVIREHVELQRVVVHREEVVAAMQPYYRRSDPVRRVDRDAYYVRHLVEGWGQTCCVELRCPSTWWQHLRLALRQRWPRLFGRLSVRFDRAIAENGAIVAGLSMVCADRLIIPYRVPTCMDSFVDAPTERHET